MADDPDTSHECALEDEVGDPQASEGSVIDEDGAVRKSSHGGLGEEGMSRLTKESGERRRNSESERSRVLNSLQEGGLKDRHQGFSGET